MEIFFAAVSATLEVKLGERKTKPSTLGFYLPTVSLIEDEVNGFVICLDADHTLHIIIFDRSYIW